LLFLKIVVKYNFKRVNKSDGNIQTISQ